VRIVIAKYKCAYIAKFSTNLLLIYCHVFDFIASTIFQEIAFEMRVKNLDETLIRLSILENPYKVHRLRKEI